MASDLKGLPEIQWLRVEDLYYRINSKNDQKTIIGDINCFFPNGKLIGLLGPSGSGKTTLLNCLSGYEFTNATATSIQINDHACSFMFLKSISSYVTQDIHLNNLLTVEENMNFVSDFKLGTKFSKQEKKREISDLLKTFGLETHSQIRTGKLSGGEKKRLAIVLELIGDPQILFIDEPTTGLDVVGARKIIKYLKSLADRGKIVICSFHQVSASQMKYLDLIYILGNGRCAYQGTPENLVPFLEEQGLPCDTQHNPADFMMELCCGEFGTDKLNILIEATSKSLQSNDNCKEISKKVGIGPNSLYLIKQTEWYFGFIKLLQRELVKARRTLFLPVLRVISALIIAVTIGWVFYDLGNDASKVFFNYNLINCIIATLLNSGLFFTILTVPFEMDVVKRELYNRYYTAMQYYLVFTIIDFPISFFCFSIPPLITYQMSGQLMETQRIVLYTTITILFGFIVHGIGLFYGSCLKLNNAILFGLLTQVPMLSISGLGLFVSHLPWYAARISKLIYVRHAFSGIMSTFWGFNRTNFECSDTMDYCFYKDASVFLEEAGGDDSEFWNNISVIMIWLLSVKFITYFAIKHRMSNFQYK